MSDKQEDADQDGYSVMFWLGIIATAVGIGMLTQAGWGWLFVGAMSFGWIILYLHAKKKVGRGH